MYWRLPSGPRLQGGGAVSPSALENFLRACLRTHEYIKCIVTAAESNKWAVQRSVREV